MSARLLVSCASCDLELFISSTAQDVRLFFFAPEFAARFPVENAKLAAGKIPIQPHVHHSARRIRPIQWGGIDPLHIHGVQEREWKKVERRQSAHWARDRKTPSIQKGQRRETINQN